MPAGDDHPISELFRLAALEWVELDGAARLLEESKSAVMSQLLQDMADMPVSRAEIAVRASAQWIDYVNRMVAARTAANTKKIEVEFLKMRFAEWNSSEANSRLERKL